MKTFNFFEKLWEHSRTLKRVGLVLALCLITITQVWGATFTSDGDTYFYLENFSPTSGWGDAMWITNDCPYAWLVVYTEGGASSKTTDAFEQISGNHYRVKIPQGTWYYFVLHRGTSKGSTSNNTGNIGFSSDKNWLLTYGTASGWTDATWANNRYFNGSEKLFIQNIRPSDWGGGTDAWSQSDNLRMYVFLCNGTSDNVWCDVTQESSADYKQSTVYSITPPEGCYKNILLVGNDRKSYTEGYSGWYKTGDIVLDPSKNYISGNFNPNRTDANWGTFTYNPITSDGTKRLYFDREPASYSYTWTSTITNTADGNFAYFFGSGNTSAWSAHAVHISGDYCYIDVPEGTWNGWILTRHSVNTNPSWYNMYDNGQATANQTADIFFRDNKNYMSDFNRGSSTATWGQYSPGAIMGSMNGDSPDAAVMTFDGNVGTVDIPLDKLKSYDFYVLDGETKYGLTDVNIITSSISNWTCSSSGTKMRMATAQEDTYTFQYDKSTHNLSIAYPDVTHPSMYYTYAYNDAGWSYHQLYLFSSASGVAGNGWSGQALYNPTTIATVPVYCFATGDYSGFKFTDNNTNGNVDQTSTLGKYLFHNGSEWTWGAFDFTITLTEQVTTTSAPSDPTVEFNGAAPSDITPPTSSAYPTFGGYYTQAGGEGLQIINASGVWQASKTGYTDENKKWIHEGGSATLYAKWTQTVTLNANGGASNGSVTATYNGGLTGFSAAGSRDGYTCLGYYTAALGGVKVLNTDGSVVSSVTDWTDGSGNWIHAGASTLYAHWQPNAASGRAVYKFQTKSSGLGTGNVCATASTNYDLTTGDGNPLETLIGGTLTAYTTNTSNLVYATNAISYANGTAGVLILTLDCPVKTGDIIRFVNYSSNSGKYNKLRHTSSSTSDNEITLSASQTAGKVQEEVVTSAFNNKDVLYIVAGSNTTAISYVEIIRPCSLTLNANTGTVGGESSLVLKQAVGDVITLPHAIKNGYRFKGWFDASSGGSQVDNPYTVTGGTTLYAQFEDCPTADATVYKFEVADDLDNGGTGITSLTDINIGSYLSNLVGGTLEGYASNANYLSIAGNNSFSFENNGTYLKVTLDCALEAGDKFKSTTANKKFVINKTEGTSGAVDLTLGSDQETVVPAGFVGEKELYIYRSGSNSPSPTISYFEVYRPTKYAVTYKANGGTGDDIEHSVAVVETCTFTAPTNLTFVGWNTEAEGTGDPYDVGDAVEEDLVLYAQWEMLPDLYIWNSNSSYGGSGKCITESVAAGDVNVTTSPKAMTVSSLTTSGLSYMGRPSKAETECTLTFTANDGLYITSICTYGKLEESAGGYYSWDGGTNWTAIAAYSETKKGFTAPDDTYPTSFKFKFTGASISTGGLWWRNALVTCEELTGYNITYNCDDADSGCPANQTSQSALPNPLPAAPTKDGYFFDGWYTNSTKTEAAVAGAALSDNVTLYAKWLALHSVTAATSTGDNSRGTVAAGSASVAETKTTTITASPGTGYKVTNWAVEGTGAEIDPEGASNSNTTTLTMGTADATVTVTFGPITYSVTLNTNDGTINEGDVTSYTYGTGATLPTDVTKSGYRFMGWYAEIDFSGDRVYTIGTSETSNKTYYAKWAQLYNITKGSPTGGSFAVKNSSSEVITQAIAGETVTIIASPSDGYNFDAWSIYKTSDAETTVPPAAATASTSFAMPAYDVTVNATFALKTYAITYAAGTNGSGSLDGGTKTHGVTYVLSNNTSAFTRTGYTYDGWATSDGGDKAYDLGGDYTTNSAQCFYPHWVIVDYDITHSDAENGTYTIKVGSASATDESTTANYNQSVTLTATPSSGYVFDHWTTSGTSVTLGNANVESTTFTMPAGDVTIGAVFKLKPNVYYYGDKYDSENTCWLNPKGATASGTDNVSLGSWTILGYGNITGVSSVTAANGSYDNKGDYRNAYIRVNTDGTWATNNIKFDLSDGYIATLKIKLGGVSSNPTIAIKPYTAYDELGDAISPTSGSIGGVTTTENNFNELTYVLDVVQSGDYALIASTTDAYISEMNLQTTKCNIISLGKNGGVGEGLVAYVAPSATRLLAGFTAPTREGYELKGYCVETDGTTKVVNVDGTLVAGVEGWTDGDGKWIKNDDVILYAKWAPLYTITFDPNGGTIDSDDDPVEVTQETENQAIDLLTPDTRSGYTFKGWRLGTTNVSDAGSTYTPTAHVTLTAAWEQNCAGGGSATLFSQNFNSATAVAYSAETARSYNTSSTLSNLVGSGANLFTSIACNSKKSAGIAINSSTGGNGSYEGFFGAYNNNTDAYYSITRTTDFAATAPTAIKVEMDIWFNSISSGTYVGVNFAIGNGFTDGLVSTSAQDGSKVHSGFSIINSTPKFYPYNSTSSAIESGTFSASTWYSIVWIINNTGSTLTYDNPTGSGTSTVANDCYDIWRKTTAGLATTYTRVASGVAATSGGVDLQEIYIGSHAGKKQEFRLDNVVVTDLNAASGSCYHVTYDGNGADGGFTSDPAAYTSGSVEVAANGYTYTHHAFRGWANTDARADEGTIDYKPGETFTITGDKTLYAVWEDLTDKYTFHYGTASTYNTGTWEVVAFEQVGATTTWEIPNFEIPDVSDYPYFYVGYQGDYMSAGTLGSSSRSQERSWDETGTGKLRLLPVTSVPVVADGKTAEGAIGTLRINTTQYEPNLQAGFRPNGYGLTYNGKTKAFYLTSKDSLWETEPIQLVAADVSATNYKVGLKTASGYVDCYLTASMDAEAIDDNQITGTPDMATGWGRFQMKSNTNANNFTLRWVPLENTTVNGTSWHDNSNWLLERVPTIDETAVIKHRIYVEEPNAQAKNVIIDKRENENAHLYIYTNELTHKVGGLIVAQDIQVKKIVDDDEVTYEGTTKDDIDIYSSADGNATLVMGGASTTTEGYYRFYSKAKSSDQYYGSWVNQFIGIPFTTVSMYEYYATYLYAYDHSIIEEVDTEQWLGVVTNSLKTLYGFKAYCILREEATEGSCYLKGTFDFPGNAAANKVLSYNPEEVGHIEGQYMFANSWTAPIYIKALNTDPEKGPVDFVGFDPTIYIFNAGSSSDVTTNAGKDDAPGQWTTIPVNTASWTDVIPATQAFALNISSPSSDTHSLTLNYKTDVYDPAYAAVVTNKGNMSIDATRAPRRQANGDAYETLRIHVQSENGAYADNVRLLVRDDFTTGFDNGWDGRKKEGLGQTPQIYVEGDAGRMAVSAEPQLEGKVIGFKAGSVESTYTISFDYDEKAEILYLLDTDLNVYTPVTREDTYTFTTTDKADHPRFILTYNRAPQTATGVDDVKEDTEVQKVLINDHIYIIRGGNMYSIDGALVK